MKIMMPQQLPAAITVCCAARIFGPCFSHRSLQHPPARPTANNPLSPSLSSPRGHHPPAMSQFGTPLFAEKDICIFLSELGMTASTEQLGKPTFELVQPIYENLVTALTGVTR